MAGDADFALLLSTIYLSKGEIKGRKRLQKIVCILKYHYSIPFQFEFRPYFYGPYSQQLADAISLLEAVGLVEEVEEELPSGILQYDYFLTKKGEKTTEEILSKGFGNETLLPNLKQALASISDLET